ncbi:RNB domain-containing ribonuclease [Salinibacterium sp. G-O1]|uniref:RNB domain-containing ribonuclease n=1 Tax=Salinibacterium sp. G-O1 TaxID=3046208 RepID=UPI0024BB153F|nr:RNB domain-containing ribonuclease [Salinibacterium sp. G-O1]MDJ0334223.1 RNB domain-containing ribonuclease [Salinibacterium sp. G-O1]
MQLLAHTLATIRADLELTEDFPPEVEAEAAATVESAVLPPDDLTAIGFVTIDPEGSTDLDQAVHIARSGDGFVVSYAIADVPLFVPPGGAVDAEARRRGQTMYAPDGRIPLHPTVISEGAASLLAGETRSAYVWTFELDAATNVTATTLRRAQVRSRQQLTYAEAQASIDDGSADESLQLLKEVGLGRIEVERERGGASLNRPDEEVEFEGGHYLLVRRDPLPVEEWNAQISLMTGMAAAAIMLDGGVGILRTMPAPDDETLENFRRQVAALGCPWPTDQAYGEYLRELDPAEPRALAAIHAATSLFRGAGYTAFDGELPEERLQAAVAAPYAHTTAPLRRLLDRFVLVTCEALTAGQPVPEWVREALPTLPKEMGRSDGVASRLDRASVDAIEAALLSDRIGEQFDVIVTGAKNGGGSIQLTDPVVTASIEGEVTAGDSVRATLVSADIASGTVVFRL